jgi:hypothetical protein
MTDSSKATRATPSRARARKPPAKAGWEERFLEELRARGAVSYACEAAGVHRSTVYRRRDEDEAFRTAWKEAESDAIDALALEARRRAVAGTEEPVFYQGQPVGAITRYSDNLLMFLLRAHRPEMYSERQRLEHSGKIENPGISIRQLIALMSDGDEGDVT